MKYSFKRLLKDFHEGGELNFLLGAITATFLIWLGTK